MSARTHTVKWISQNEINDIFAATNVVTSIVDYLTYPRTMGMTAADLLEDYELATPDLSMTAVAERMAFSILDENLMNKRKLYYYLVICPLGFISSVRYSARINQYIRHWFLGGVGPFA